MKQRDERRLPEEINQQQAEFPAMGTPVNPVDERWMSFLGEETPLSNESE